MKIYISGAISCDPDYEKKFWLAECALIGKGHVVMNPSILPPGFSWDEYMIVALAMQSVCDATLLLKDWQNSPGAQIEQAEAIKAKQHVYYNLEDVPNV